MKSVQFSIIILLMSLISTQAGETGLVLEHFFPVRPALIAEVAAAPALPLQTFSEPKSKGKAFLMSLLLPGLGERYCGAARKSELFMGTEIALWLGYAGFITYREWREDEYHSYAVAHAGVDPAGKTETYYIDISNYADIDAYNAAKLRQRNLADYYKDVDANYWKWESDAHRVRFDQMRLSAARADNRATFVLGAIFANHLISAIDAVWSVHKHNSKLAQRLDWDVRLGDGMIQPNVNLSLQVRL